MDDKHPYLHRYCGWATNKGKSFTSSGRRYLNIVASKCKSIQMCESEAEDSKI